ncbi:hypothetical protein Hanom_Chr16g01523441 [Helianthus anomalus]
MNNKHYPNSGNFPDLKTANFDIFEQQNRIPFRSNNSSSITFTSSGLSLSHSTS